MHKEPISFQIKNQRHKKKQKKKKKISRDNNAQSEIRLQALDQKKSKKKQQPMHAPFLKPSQATVKKRQIVKRG